MRRAALCGIAVAVAAAGGCVLDDDPVAYPLRDGPYYASWDTMIANDCFASGIPIPRGYTLVFHADASADDVEVTWPSLSDGLGPMSGRIAKDGAYEISSFAPYALTTGCTLGVSTFVTGMGFSKTLATFRLTAAFDANTTASNGFPSDCSAFEGETVDNFPFPTLSDPANGACSITVEGVAHFGSAWWR